jgi:hypothetical protein
MRSWASTGPRRAGVDHDAIRPTGRPADQPTGRHSMQRALHTVPAAADSTAPELLECSDTIYDFAIRGSHLHRNPGYEILTR